MFYSYVLTMLGFVFPLVIALTGVSLLLMIILWAVWGYYENSTDAATISADTTTGIYNAAIAFSVIGGVGLLMSIGWRPLRPIATMPIIGRPMPMSRHRRTRSRDNMLF